MPETIFFINAIVIVEMKHKCLLCSIQSVSVQLLIRHISYHQVDENEILLKNYFHQIPSKKTVFCSRTFKSCRVKKNRMFLCHYGKQLGSGTNSINVLRRDKFDYYTINFDQHRNIYNFFDGGLVHEFIRVVHQNFKAGKHNRTFQGYVEIVTQQRGETILQKKQVWLTNSFKSKYFNNFIMSETRDGITKRTISNGETGSSWYFKKFNRLTIIVGPRSVSKLLLN